YQLKDLVGFYFSSRRRHTSFSRDWSSDVCSSDLRIEVEERFDIAAHQRSSLFGGISCTSYNNNIHDKNSTFVLFLSSPWRQLPRAAISFYPARCYNTRPRVVCDELLILQVLGA